MKKVNFGCFHQILDGWINVDFVLRHIIISKIPFLPYVLYRLKFLRKEIYLKHKTGVFKKIKYGDVRKKLKFRDNSVDYIFLSHMLEHLYKEEAGFFIGECYRIMKKGASMRLELPDFRLLVKQYEENINAKEDKWKAMSIFNSMLYEPNEKDQPVGHKFMYDEFSLKHALEKEGFRNCKTYDLGKGNFPNVEIFITKGKEGSLIMECDK